MIETYFAKLLFVSSAPESDYRALHEETHILVRAKNIDEAHGKAEQYGQKSEHHYKSVGGYHIKWHFLEVLEIAVAIDDDYNEDIMELSGWFFHDRALYDKLRKTDD